LKPYDIAILTESRYYQPQEVDWYIQNILTEDDWVLKAFEEQGLRVIRLDWADLNFDWSSIRAAVFRTTWDYFHKFTAFSKWLDKAATETQLINSAELIRWNMDKHYLKDLSDKGVNVPSTHYIEKGETASLQYLHEQNDWSETVLKPAISGAGRHTYHLNTDNLLEHEGIFQQLIKEEAMLLQPFQHNIVNKGEVAYMVFGGKYSHAVLKIAKEGDFRVQDDFGGTVHSYSPSEEEIQFAEECFMACSPQPAYARVDVIKDNEGKLALAELELIEPELWFRKYPKGANHFAQAVIDKMK